MQSARLVLFITIVFSSVVGAQICGDCNESGDMNILDALTVAKIGAGLPTLGTPSDLCDVDRSGDMTVLDALLIARNAAGLPAVLDCTPPTPPTPVTPPPASRQWVSRTPSTSPSPRGMAAMAFDSNRGVTVLFGGSASGGSSALGDTWEYDGNNWALRSSESGPVARLDHAMAYDSARQVTVLFGGMDSTGYSGLNDTWEWDGASWTQVITAITPEERYGHSMVYDDTRGQIVLWGGSTTMYYSYDNSVWTFNGAGWQQHTAPLAPNGGYWHAMVYDSARERTLLLGADHCPTSAQTWEWDGVGGWQQHFPVAPPMQREQHDMAFDSIHGITVLFGGSFTYYGNATELWNGSEWQTIYPATAPAARGGHSMVFDSTRGKVVLFGGGDWFSVVTGDTWEF